MDSSDSTPDPNLEAEIKAAKAAFRVAEKRLGGASLKSQVSKMLHTLSGTEEKVRQFATSPTCKAVDEIRKEWRRFDAELGMAHIAMHLMKQDENESDQA